MNLENDNNILHTSYKKIIDDMPYGMFIADTKGNFLYSNRLARELFDHELSSDPKDRWKGDLGMYTIDKKTKYKPEQSPMVKSINGEVILGEKLFIKSVKNKEGLYIKISSYPIYDGKCVEAAILLFEDITKEELLIESFISKITDLEKYIKDTLSIGDERQN